METIIVKNQIHFDKLSKNNVGYNNIMYIEEQTEDGYTYSHHPIDWNNEYVKIVIENNFIELVRIKYNFIII